jgi:hypothetical protein
VAAGEDEAQAVVGDLQRGRRLDDRDEVGGVGVELARERLLSPDAIDRQVSRSLDEPGARVLRDSVVAPALKTVQENRHPIGSPAYQYAHETGVVRPRWRKGRP